MGWIWLAAGEVKSGKSWHARNTILRPQVGEHSVVITYSPERDDRLEYGPTLTPARVRALEHTPHAFGLAGCTHLEAIEIALVAVQRWHTFLLLDEVHEIFPSKQAEERSPLTPAERARLREIASKLVNRVRHPHGRHHLSLVGCSQSYTDISLALRARSSGVDFFHLEAERDLVAIRTRWGAGAALQVYRLPPRQYVRIAKGHPLPDGWTGYVDALARQAKASG